MGNTTTTTTTSSSSGTQSMSMTGDKTTTTTIDPYTKAGFCTAIGDATVEPGRTFALIGVTTCKSVAAGMGFTDLADGDCEYSVACTAAELASHRMRRRLQAGPGAVESESSVSITAPAAEMAKVIASSGGEN